MKGSLFGRKQAELTALSRRQGSALVGLSPDAEHTAQAESQETGTLHDNNFHGDPSFPKAGAAGGLCPTQEGDPQGHHDNGGEKQHQLQRAKAGHCHSQPKGDGVHSPAPGKPGADVGAASFLHLEPLLSAGIYHTIQKGGKV